MFILIIALIAGDYHGGNAVTTAEFSSKATCEAAAQAYFDNINAPRTSALPRAICVPK
jgi:hypothetical protein